MTHVYAQRSDAILQRLDQRGGGILQKRMGMQATADRGGGSVPSVVHDVLASPGQPLGAATRAFFEPRFGHDFSQVRVYTDEKAARSAKC